MMDSMMKIVQFLSKEDMPRRLITTKTRIWGCYRKRVLFHINELCKQAMNLAQYGHMSIGKEMHCADNIMVAHYNMNQVVRFLTSTIGHVHNISIKPAQHGRKRRRKSDGDNKRPLPTLIHKQTPLSYDCVIPVLQPKLKFCVGISTVIT